MNGQRDTARASHVRVLVAGSTPVFEAALSTLLRGLPGVTLVTDFGPPPDLALLLCSDPGELAELAALRCAEPDLAVLCLAMSWTAPQAALALEAGAAGCLGSAISVDELAAAIRQGARGEMTVSADLAPGLIAHLARRREPTSRPSERTLTAREREVLAFVCDGLGNKQIAQRLYLSLRTVENHLASIYSKLGVGSRTEAAVLAVRSGLAGVTDRTAAPGLTTPADALEPSLRAGPVTCAGPAARQAAHSDSPKRSSGALAARRTSLCT